jgi:hypothetical protein
MGARNRPDRMLNVYSIPRESLLVARPVGIFDRSSAESLVEFVEIKEELSESGFNRFCDLTRLKGIELTTEDVLRLAARRRVFNPNTIRVKSAFLATDPLAFGIARMYEHVLNSPRIEVTTWWDLQSAANWLGVEADLLTL